MSIIKVTEKMLRKFVTLDKNWYAFEVVEVDGPKPNKKQTLELRITAKVIQGDNAGAEVMFYQYPDSFAGPFIALASAIEGVEIQPGMEIDPEKWVGKQYWAEANEDMYEGKIRNKFEEFRHIESAPAF